METSLPAWPWPVAAAPPFPAPGEAHVWAFSLALEDAVLDSPALLLSEDEQARAARFRFERDRRRYVAARGGLRRLLARYTGTPPAALLFDYEPYGKPVLRGGGLHFNLSHSGDRALCAVAARRVGVDLEVIEPDRADGEAAALVFSPAENRALGALAGPARAEAFFSYWTFKEAFLKAEGLGLQAPVRDYTLASEADADGFRVMLDGEGRAVLPWRLLALPVGEGCRAALAAAGKPERVRCLQFQPGS